MMYRKSCNNKNSGLILVDVLIAFALAVIFVTTLTQTTIHSRNIFEIARERNRLLHIFETVQSEFYSLLPYETKILHITDDEWGIRPTIEAVAGWYGNERIETRISITSSSSELIIFSTIRAYPFETLDEVAGTPLCAAHFTKKDPVGSYSFLHPVRTHNESRNRFSVSIQALSLPISSSLPLTDLEVRNGIAYISTDSTIASDPDIIVADIRDPEHIIVLSSFNTGPGISAIVLAGNRIFAAAASTAAQLHVIKINSLNSLSIETKYQLPLPYATATPPMGSSVFFNGKQVLLGTQKWAGGEFSIIDVQTPSNLTLIGTLETGTKINDFYERANTAYAAASDEKQLRTIDVSNLNNPVLTDTFSPSGWERQEGKSLYFFEDGLTLGRTSGGFNIHQDHELFFWPQATSTENFQSLDIPGGIYGIIADREHIFTATHQTGKEFQIINRSPEILATSTENLYALPVHPQTLTCDNSVLYALGYSGAVVYQITFD